MARRERQKHGWHGTPPFPQPECAGPGFRRIPLFLSSPQPFSFSFSLSIARTLHTHTHTRAGTPPRCLPVRLAFLCTLCPPFSSGPRRACDASRLPLAVLATQRTTNGPMRGGTAARLLLLLLARRAVSSFFFVFRIRAHFFALCAPRHSRFSLLFVLNTPTLFAFYHLISPPLCSHFAFIR